MAIKINIPGFGEVEVEGAAQEDTMQAILAAVSKSDKSKQTEEKKLKQAKEDEAKAAGRVTTEFEKLEAQTKADADKSKIRNDQIAKDAIKASKDSIAQVGNFGIALAATAANVALSMIKNMDANAENPIALGAALINTGIDIFAGGLKLAMDATVGLAGAMLESVPILGGALTGVAKVSKEVIDTVASGAKAANEFMKGQFEQTVASIKAMTAAGASFAGGMTEMRRVANESGVGLTAFTNILVKSKGNFQEIGITASESAHLISKGMEGLTKSVRGTNGQMTTTRDQLQALGYNYEEQGEIMTLYMQQQAIAGKNLANIAPAELAAGTKEYAKNLKVISDFTGKDAKVIMQKAQAESMRGALLDKLTAKQKVSFEAAYAGLEILGPKAAVAQLDLMQRLATDGASNIAEIQANPAMAEAQAKLAQGVLDTSATMVTARAGIIDAANTKSTLGKDTDIVGLMGIAGVGKDVGEMQNAINRFRGASKEAGDASIKSAEAQLQAQDPTTKAYSKAVASVTEFQVAMQELASVHMADYAKMVVASIDMMKKVIVPGIDFAMHPGESAAKMAGVVTDDMTAKTTAGEVGGYAGTAAGAWGGAETGAILGSFVGPIGTVVGGVLGGIIGGGVGFYAGTKAGDAMSGTPSTPGGKPNANAPGDYHATLDQLNGSKKATKASSQPAHDAVAQMVELQKETNKHLSAQHQLLQQSVTVQKNTYLANS